MDHAPPNRSWMYDGVIEEERWGASMSDGYSSNLSRCVDVNRGKVIGMKSHDCHVFMECLLPIASTFGRWKKTFHSFFARWREYSPPPPPSFFDSMEHLPIHLPYEARLGGPVQYRWMYPFERTTLSAFDQGGHHSGRESTDWLSDEELRSADDHVHEEPLSVKNQHLRDLSLSPLRCVKEWHTYFVNGYKFHTHAWTQGKRTINSWVHVKGLTEGGEDDFYGGQEWIQSMALWIFKWIKDMSCLILFIIAHNVEQVYYVPYPVSRTDKQGWCVAIKTKPRGRIDSNEVEAEVPYQVEEMSHVNDIIEVEKVIRLQDIEADLQEVDPNNVPSVEGYMDEETSESEEECSEEGQSEDEAEDSFQTSSS
ncbi:hypothetical protein V8G54_009138 [Vigna mungo]|uniref:DUF4218 domain-containing protein n=1 Tax=Vigna mungo TaxID=3915 RepID=A0AAQ3S559_VIGMU